MLWPPTPITHRKALSYGGEFELDNAKTTRVTLDSERMFTVRDMVVDVGFRIRRIMYWCEINGQRVSDDAKVRVVQSFAVLQGEPEAGLVAVSAMCGLDCAEAGGRIRDFIVSMGDALNLEYAVVRGDSE